MNTRKRLTRQAASLSLGGRDLPLEADLKADVAYDHELVGKDVEVSSIAGGTLHPYRDRKAVIQGVITRFGEVVGYQVTVGGKVHHGPAKDFYVDRSIVEGVQPPTATSVALREGLSHWGQQRTYWHTQAAGLESMAFAVASVTPQAVAQHYEWGWDFAVPDLMPGGCTTVRCPAFQHNDFWTVTTSVFPLRGGLQPKAPLIEDHWQRTFMWTLAIADGMSNLDTDPWPWKKAVASIKARMLATERVLVPLLNKCLNECLEARREISGSAPDLPPGSVSVGFSSVRLKPNTIGLTEPPTDRRPYTVISIAPQAARSRHYLRQVVLHECIHIAVDNGSGEKPHNDLFNAIAERVGLEPKHRD